MSEELVAATVAACEHLAGSAADGAACADAEAAEGAAEVSRLVSSMKALLYGEPHNPPPKEEALALAQRLLESDLVRHLLRSLPVLEFECRKDVVQARHAAQSQLRSSRIVPHPSRIHPASH